jgi:hypothetical protein
MGRPQRGANALGMGAARGRCILESPARASLRSCRRARCEASGGRSSSDRCACVFAGRCLCRAAGPPGGRRRRARPHTAGRLVRPSSRGTLRFAGYARRRPRGAGAGCVGSRPDALSWRRRSPADRECGARSRHPPDRGRPAGGARGHGPGGGPRWRRPERGHAGGPRCSAEAAVVLVSPAPAERSQTQELESRPGGEACRQGAARVGPRDATRLLGSVRQHLTRIRRGAGWCCVEDGPVRGRRRLHDNQTDSSSRRRAA